MENVPVTAIADSAFLLCDNLTALTVGPNVESIGAYAFHGCVKPASITFQGHVTAYDEGAFSACKALAALPFPADLTAIPPSLAEGSGLTALALPDTVQSIGGHVFPDCADLRTVSFGTGLSAMGDRAFTGCTTLQSVALPSSLKNVPTGAFSGCLGMHTLSIPEGTQTLGNFAFAACDTLKNVTLPESLTSVGASAFAGCHGLESVIFLNKDTTLGEEAIALCPEVELRAHGSGRMETQTRAAGLAFRNLMMVFLSNAVLETQDPMVGMCMTWRASALLGTAPYTYAFSVYCGEALIAASGAVEDCTFTHIPQKDGDYHAAVTVTDALGSTAKLTTLRYTVKPSDDLTPDQMSYTLKNGGYIITAVHATPGKMVFPAYMDDIPVTGIGDGSALGSSLVTKQVVLPGIVRTIGYEAFSSFKVMESIKLNEGLQEIGNGAFYQCYTLEEIAIPSTVTTIDEGAFSYSPRIKHMVVPASVTDRGNGLFIGCTGLETVIGNAPPPPIPQNDLLSLHRPGHGNHQHPRDGDLRFCFSSIRFSHAQRPF